MVLILTVLKQYKLLLESRHEVEPPDSVIWLESQPFLPLSSKSSKSVGVMLWPLGMGNNTVNLWIELPGRIKDGVISITQEDVVLLGAILWSSLFDLIMQFLRSQILTQLPIVLNVSKSAPPAKHNTTAKKRQEPCNNAWCRFITTSCYTIKLRFQQ